MECVDGGLRGRPLIHPMSEHAPTANGILSFGSLHGYRVISALGASITASVATTYGYVAGDQLSVSVIDCWLTMMRRPLSCISSAGRTRRWGGVVVMQSFVITKETIAALAGMCTLLALATPASAADQALKSPEVTHTSKAPTGYTVTFRYAEDRKNKRAFVHRPARQRMANRLHPGQRLAPPGLVGSISREISTSKPMALRLTRLPSGPSGERTRHGARFTWRSLLFPQ